MKVIGIDIGTTSICGIVADPEQAKLLRSVTLANDSAIKTEDPFARCQDPSRILQLCETILQNFLREFPDTDAIGLTGQMHGIVYLNASGDPVSPLFTWQDAHGKKQYRDSVTYAQELTRRTGYAMASGYGLTTLFYHRRNGEIPKDAASLCTIHDYVAMKLCGNTAPVIHISDAASFGLFDLGKLCFDLSALENAKLDAALLPALASECRFIGNTIENIPVCVPLGDNQASVLGSLCGDGVLVNVGTGSQVSVICDEYIPCGNIEYRPFLNGKYLMTGCALAGGYSYSLLKNFFSLTLTMFGTSLPENAYECMNKSAEKALRTPDSILCRPYFCGTRENPDLRASFSDIGQNNFTPGDLTLSVLKGISGELHGFYENFCKLLRHKPTKLVGSGNGIRKNKLLADIFSKQFGMPLQIPLYEEEAAFGCAFAAYAALKNISETQIRNSILYK